MRQDHCFSPKWLPTLAGPPSGGRRINGKHSTRPSRSPDICPGRICKSKHSSHCTLWFYDQHCPAAHESQLVCNLSLPKPHYKMTLCQVLPGGRQDKNQGHVFGVPLDILSQYSSTYFNLVVHKLLVKGSTLETTKIFWCTLFINSYTYFKSVFIYFSLNCRIY